MPKISSVLAVHDGMTGPLKNMCSSLNLVISKMRSLEMASNEAADMSEWNEATEALGRVQVQLQAIEDNYEDVNSRQRQFNKQLVFGADSAGSLMTKITGIAGAYLGIKELAGLSDNLSAGRQRISLFLDDENSVESLDQKIYDSAQRARVSYTDTLNIVSKLGLTASKAFSGNDEMVYFSELMAKNFKIGGASASEQASAMYQLTQAMSSGRLQGDEYRSIIENAPLLAQSIEDYMRKVKGATGSMKEWASEGLLTSDVIKNAMFASARGIKERFDSLPMTWGEVWTTTVNKVTRFFDPLLKGISFVAKNWSLLEPIVVGLAIAIGGLAATTAIYNGYMKVSKSLKSISAAYTAMHTVAIGAETTATFGATAAQYGLNAAILACPLTWVLLIIIAVIAAFYAIVAAVNKFAKTSVSATGIIAGSFMWLLSVIGNIFIALINIVIDAFAFIWNVIALVANFLANVFIDPVGSVVRLFFDLVDSVLNILQIIAKAIDTIFGTNLASSIKGWRESLGGWVDEKFEQKVEIMPTITEAAHIDRIDNTDAFGYGYAAGSSFEDKISGSTGAISYDIGDIADNTAEINDTLTRSEEELEYLRDIAEKEAINRFTTAEIKVDFSGMTNRIEGDADINGFIEALTDDFSIALATAAEGVR